MPLFDVCVDHSASITDSERACQCVRIQTESCENPVGNCSRLNKDDCFARLDGHTTPCKRRRMNRLLSCSATLVTVGIWTPRFWALYLTPPTTIFKATSVSCVAMSVLENPATCLRQLKCYLQGQGILKASQAAA